MPKKTRRPSPVNANAASRTSAGLLIGTALIAALAGAGLSRTVAPAKPVKPAAAIPAPAPGSPSVVSVPLPEAKDEAASPPMPSPDIVLGLPANKVALNLGDWSYNHGNYTAAAAYYQEAIRRGIDNADVRTDLGSAIRYSGDSARALKEYQAAHAKWPQHENSLFNQGLCYIDLGNTKSAIAVWQQYLTQFPHGEHIDVARELISKASSPTGK